ncbi:MAG: adenylate/guanylate cyclase domain-containing protein [Candidatus Riflebacteria bacterium]|nr:adenylate/guanylate cyclase domain-containing protein [Candidatus Riflebacteria bacterium]
MASGIFDYLSGKTEQEFKTLKMDNFRLSERLKKLEVEVSRSREFSAKHATQMVALLVQIRELAGCVESESSLEIAWGILTKSLELKKGAIYLKSGEAWNPVRSTGFQDNAPIVPDSEDSVFSATIKAKVMLTLKAVRQDPAFSALEGRGLIPDILIASPFKIERKVGGLIVVCRALGKTFSEDDSMELLRLLSSILGLSLSNSNVIARQKETIEQKTREADHLKGIFSKMVSPKIVETLTNNPQGIVLGGKREKIVVFFTDIRGFTSLSEKLPPEKTVELLNKYFSTVSEIVIKYNGTLDKYIGDAVMALFNTPVSIDEPVKAAFLAATEIQNALKESAIIGRQEGFPDFSIGIGMSFQEVVVGYVGSERMASFTAIGDGVNIASRLCSIAKGGEIAVSEEFFEALEYGDGFEVREGIKLKGKEKPTRVYVFHPS